MSTSSDDLPVKTEYRAQFIERTGREPYLIPTGWKKFNGQYRRVWARNPFAEKKG